MLRMITAGESHGSKIVGILEGLPAGLKIELDYIREILKRRQGGKGRGKRMSIEPDEPVICGGTYNGITTGAPILLEIINKADNPAKGRRTIPRPGHADYTGCVKYKLKDLNIPAERASARETAIRTALGAICKLALRELNITVIGFTKGIGKIKLRKIPNAKTLLRQRNSSPVYCPEREASELMIKEIEKAQKKGETLGGSFTVIAKNVPKGLGSYSQWDRRLDAALGFSMLSIPSVKAVEIGDAIKASEGYGSKFHDLFTVKNGKIARKSNHAGGIEGGISNGEDIVITAYLKPIPSTPSIRSSINLENLSEEPLEYIRSDTVIIPAASIVGEAMVSFTLLQFILDKFGGDSISELKERVKQWRKETLVSPL